MAVTTGEVRIGYVHLLQPYAMPGQDEKYSCQIIIPKEDTQTKALLDNAIEEAKERGLSGSWNGQAPPIIPTPLHDGDGTKENGEPYRDECKGSWVMSVSADVNHKPSVVDLQLQPIIDPNEIYSGMYGRVNVNFYPYLYNGKKGVGVGLNHVQKTRDGEPLGGNSVTLEEAFGMPQQKQAAVDPITGQPK